jgi:hypothetical protein
MSTVEEMITDWTGSGGVHAAFHQGGDLLNRIPADTPLDHRIKGGVCFAASTCFIKCRNIGYESDRIVALLKDADQAEKICQRQDGYFKAKNWDEKYTVNGMQHAKLFDSARPAELSSREKVLEQIGKPGLYIFEAYSTGVPGKGHSIAFDTRNQNNVYFFDANSGIYSGRGLQDFREWYKQYWEASHGVEEPGYKAQFKRGSRRLFRYSAGVA